MKPLSRALELIQQTEVELRQLLLNAAQQGDYETARMLAEWASQLQQLHKGSVGGAPRDGELVYSQMQTNTEHNAFARTIRDHEGKSIRTFSAKKTKVEKRKYPKFLRDGEELVKIGWSKREKKAYRHKAPKRVVLLVAQALQRFGQNGKRFMMDQILPIHDSESAADVPSYQAYLSLAWLRQEKMIIQHGRQGYSLRPDINLTDAVEECWKHLLKS
jgi:hypothetical protein